MHSAMERDEELNTALAHVQCNIKSRRNRAQSAGRQTQLRHIVEGEQCLKLITMDQFENLGRDRHCTVAQDRAT